ncbi:sugar phosphate isomerase/epimerase family protein [Bradyrhizobium daqingense]|uniref:sugar phosphate isomerase/epimerase family protein n=1 Tax=Bradyrhizobium daqingense TaxID=993502 RepID=UPI0038380E25
MLRHQLNRRALLSFGGTLLLGPHSSSDAAAPQRPAGLQLYTVRKELATNFQGTLRAVHQIGYAKVEFAGIYATPAANTRDVLQDFGLSAVSAHIPLADLLESASVGLDVAGQTGASFIVCPWVDEGLRRTKSDWLHLCDRLNAIGATLRKAGLAFAYHNHDFEFHRLDDGTLPYALLLDRTERDFVEFELDVYWAKRGGVDPIHLVHRIHDRIKLLHLKDMTRDGSITELGNGIIDFPRLICRASISADRMFVEQDDSKDPVSSIAVSFDYLKRQTCKRERG